MKKWMLLPLVFMVTLSTTRAADLQVSIEGLEGGKGPLYVALYDKAGFPMLGRQIAGLVIKPDQPAIFQNLAPGEYAVSTFQDLNDNGKLDMNMVGMPLEPYGFSNNAMGIMGPPTFEAAAIRLGSDNQTIAIKLR